MLVLGDRRNRLSTDEWAGGAVDPAGHVCRRTFDLGRRAARRWAVGGVVLEREMAMQHGRPLVAVTHRLLPPTGPCGWSSPRCARWRDQHGDRRGDGDPAVEEVDGGFVFEGRYRVRRAGWSAGGAWYRGAFLRAEAERGLGAARTCGRRELRRRAAARRVLGVVAFAGTARRPGAGGRGGRSRRRAGAAGAGAAAGAADAVERDLVLAADQL